MRTLLAFQQDPDPFQIISNFLESPILRISGQLVLLLFIVLWVSLVYWTYADASTARVHERALGLRRLHLSVLRHPGLPHRTPPEYLEESRERELELAVLERELRNGVLLCPNCRNLVERDYLICPSCTWELKKSCINCDKPLNMEWGTCPYCGTDQRSGKTIVR